MDTNIVIRTLVLRDGRMDLQVGGAVTYDSDPESEYAETLAKGRALLGALGAEPEEW
jgi:anthranilate/para-aminobenzoate synthase component I